MGGITPIRRVIKALLEEVLGVHKRELSFTDFVQVMRKLRSREGFATCDILKFKTAYEKFATDQKLQTRDLSSLSIYLGYAVSKRDVHAIGREVDCNDSGVLLEREFLISMRKIHEREVAKVKQSIALGPATQTLS